MNLRSNLAARRTLLLLACTLPGAVAPATASEPWIAPGDMQVRHDLQLLVDSGVIELPLTAWPIAVSDIAFALSAPRSQPRAAAVAGPLSVEQPASSQLTSAQHAAWSRLHAIAQQGRLAG